MREILPFEETHAELRQAIPGLFDSDVPVCPERSVIRGGEMP